MIEEKDKKLAPEPYYTAYTNVLERAILELRMWIRYEEKVSLELTHDLMDAIHNIPELLYSYKGWYVHKNIVRDLKEYDDKWSVKEGLSGKLNLCNVLKKHLKDAYDVVYELTEEESKKCIKTLSIMIVEMLREDETSFCLTNTGNKYSFNINIDIPDSLTIDLYPKLMLELKHIFQMDTDVERTQVGHFDLKVTDGNIVPISGNLEYTDTSEIFTVRIGEA